MSRLYLSNPCALFAFLHTVLRAQSAPGFPCALSAREGQRIGKAQAKSRREIENACLSVVIARSEATKQSSFASEKQESWIASAFAQSASADSQPCEACAASG